MFIKERLVALNNALNSLTSTVNTLDSDSLWNKMTPSTNFNGSSDYCAYRQVGKLVEVRFMVTPKKEFSAGGEDLMIAYGLPENCQPATWGVRGVAFHNGNAYRIEIPIKTNANGGKIYIARNANGLSSGYLITGQIMFIRGALLNIINSFSPKLEVGIC